MWDAFCTFKLKKPSKIVLSRLFGSKEPVVEEHDFDGLRIIMHNFDRHFVDVPIISVQSDLPSEKDWLMKAHTNETFKAYAIAFVLRDMAKAAPNPEEVVGQEATEQFTELMSKLSFMYHYCMNFRSKHTRELRTNVRRKVITEAEHELGTS